MSIPGSHFYTPHSCVNIEKMDFLARANDDGKNGAEDIGEERCPLFR